ncbi:MAG: DUF4147 domain-containing protein [Lentisphaeria bacterium]
MQPEMTMHLIQAALAAVEPGAAVRVAVGRDGDVLSVAGHAYNLRDYDRVFLAGGGKAGAPMAQALAAILGDRLTAGWVNVKEGHLARGTVPAALTIHEARHPVPDAAGLAGAERVLALAREAGARDLLFCLISGGGSALLPAPAASLSLDDVQALTGVLLRCGATINEVNAVRKHVSRLAGGQLARAAAPAAVVSLILSDVVGSPLDVIASGPTVPDGSTFAEALAVLDRYGVTETVPATVRAHLLAGRQGRVPETPKPGDRLFRRVQNVIVGGNAIAAQAAKAEAERLGFHALVLSTYVEGEAREVGRVAAGIAKSLTADGLPLARPACVILGGETTVTVRGAGRGGRNQELALAAALALDGWAGVTVIALATDGTDGPTDAAGAVVTGDTVRRAREQGLDAAAFLAANDAYTFFDRAGGLLRTGPTNTNVNDLTVILAE